MKISDDTKNIVNFLNHTLNGNLQKTADLEVILEIGATYGLIDEFNQILFLATSLHNINQTLQRHHSEDFSNIEKLQKEKIKTFLELQELLKSFIENEDEIITSRFNKVYFGNTQGNFVNISDLAHDLAALNDIIKHFKQNQT